MLKSTKRSICAALLLTLIASSQIMVGFSAWTVVTNNSDSVEGIIRTDSIVKATGISVDTESSTAFEYGKYNFFNGNEETDYGNVSFKVDIDTSGLSASLRTESGAGYTINLESSITLFYNNQSVEITQYIHELSISNCVSCSYSLPTQTFPYTPFSITTSDKTSNASFSINYAFTKTLLYKFGGTLSSSVFILKIRQGGK